MQSSVQILLLVMAVVAFLGVVLEEVIHPMIESIRLVVELVCVPVASAKFFALAIDEFAFQLPR